MNPSRDLAEIAVTDEMIENLQKRADSMKRVFGDDPMRDKDVVNWRISLGIIMKRLDEMSNLLDLLDAAKTSGTGRVYLTAESVRLLDIG
jgi:hypothetical protein